MGARSLLAGAALLAYAAAGCGGGGGGGGAADSEQDVQQVVKDFATAVNKRDGKKLCNELITRSYLEQVTLAKGATAVKQCERQIDSARLQQKYKVVKFDKTKIDGERATVTAELESRGVRRPQVFRLRKQDGKFKLTSGATD